MDNELYVGGKIAIRLDGVVFKIHYGVGGYFVYYSGWEGWVPKSISRRDGEKILVVQQWFYDKKIQPNIYGTDTVSI